MMLDKYKDRLCYWINLNLLQTPNQICGILRQRKISQYVYGFQWQHKSLSIVLKYGISAENKGQPGERIYRQAGHLNGWPCQLEGSSGADMLQLRLEMLRDYNSDIDRNDVKIWLLDMTPRINDPVYDVYGACVEVENYLIKEHINRVGFSPPGNRCRVARPRKTSNDANKVLDKFFTFE